MVLASALSWLTLLGLPEGGCLPPDWRPRFAQWGRVSVLRAALTLLAPPVTSRPPSCPRPAPAGGYA
jgi:hypothetical protein